jgi:hypothetical protein
VSGLISGTGGKKKYAKRLCDFPSEEIPWSRVNVRIAKMIKLLPAMPRIVLAIFGFERSGVGWTLGEGSGQEEQISFISPPRVSSFT